MSNNLVIGLALGYTVDTVKPFVLSLRRYYQGQIVFVVGDTTAELNNFFADNKVHTYVPDSIFRPGYQNIDRFRFYLDCLDHFENFDNIMLSDIRDVVFQSNPFEKYPEKDIEFFAEPALIKDCVHNGPWYEKLFGKEELEKVGNQYILCAGTTLGRQHTIIKYIKSLILEIEKLEKSGKAHATCDQAVHNFIVYNEFFENYRINHNGQGLVSTMHHSKQLKFDRQGRLLNDDGLPTPVIHQYDRCGPMSVVFLKNALGVTGRIGIKQSAEYAANNFYEHDLT
jgi:hypothetical protein